MIKVHNIREKLKQIKEYWDPHILAELNGQEVKLAKLKGSFSWHYHEHEDEMFYVIQGQLKIELLDQTLFLGPGECCVIPRGVEHRPVADQEVAILLFEPARTLNTGNIQNEFTQKELKKIK